jgi:hypothetical protein
MMSQKSRLITAFVAVALPHAALVLGDSPGDRKPGVKKLTLVVSKSADSTKAVDKSNMYVADLLNSGERPEILEAVQMPGGYVGSGRFYACSLERWSAQRQEWESIRPATLSEFGRSPQLMNVEVKPGGREEVCRMMLPSQAGSAGDRVRFRFRARWSGRPSIDVVSQPFVLGK